MVESIFLSMLVVTKDFCSDIHNSHMCVRVCKAEKFTNFSLTRQVKRIKEKV